MNEIELKMMQKTAETLMSSLKEEPVEQPVLGLTRKVTLGAANVTVFVEDERTAKAAKLALALLAMKFASDIAEAMSNPAKLASIFGIKPDVVAEAEGSEES